ncbi:TPA_asm: P0 protein [Piper methysticum polerovirus]|uniref:P0 protein n=1 Tax=Piper methysticum polerovirus TaxID=2885088 RepID=A0AAD2KQ94_9VIRU|nr:TPA_asm: P0 protein [Piper methysticum polerovirus]
MFCIRYDGLWTVDTHVTIHDDLTRTVALGLAINNFQLSYRAIVAQPASRYVFRHSAHLVSFVFLLPLVLNSWVYFKPNRAYAPRRFLRAILHWGFTLKYYPQISFTERYVVLHLNRLCGNDWESLLFRAHFSDTREGPRRLFEDHFSGLGTIPELLRLALLRHKLRLDQLERLSAVDSCLRLGNALLVGGSLGHPYGQNFRSAYLRTNMHVCVNSLHLEGAALDIWKLPGLDCYLPPEDILDGSLVQSELGMV